MVFSQAVIFDRTSDRAVFVLLPLFLSLLFFLEAFWIAIFLGAVLALDSIHTFLSCFRIDFIKKVRTELGFRNIVILKFAASVLLLFVPYYYGGIVGLLISVKYISIYHFAKQQFGWLRLINKKTLAVESPDSAARKKLMARISEGAIHLGCLGPILIAHSSLYYFSWYNPTPNLIHLNNTVAALLMRIYLALMLGFVLWEIWIHYKGWIEFNLTRISIMIFTLVGWGVTILSDHKSLKTALLFITSHHVLSYVFLLYSYNVKVRQQRLNHFFLMFAMMCLLYILITLSRNSIAELPGTATETMRFFFSAESYRIFYWTVPLLWLPTMFHFLIDADLWKGVDLEHRPAV
jgi:hypothetical protein